MNKFQINILLAMVMVSIIGCGTSQPTPQTQTYKQHIDNFNPNNTRIQFINGKPYGIPVDTTYQYVTYAKAAEYRKYGYNKCNSGDVLWIYNPQNGNSLENFREILLKGHIGCISPLSNQEYKYMLKAEQQRFEALKAMAGFDTQKIYVEHNVNVTHW